MNTIRPIMVVPPSQQHSIPDPVFVVPPSRQHAIPDPVFVVPPSRQHSIPDPVFVVPPSRQHAIPDPIFVVPPSRQHSEPDMSSRATRTLLSRRIASFFSVDRKPAKSGPLNADRFPSCDVTPWNEFGVTRTAYNVNGELWIESVPTARQGKPTWYDAGRI